MNKLLAPMVIWVFLFVSDVWGFSPGDFQGIWRGGRADLRFYTVKVSNISCGGESENCSCNVQISWPLRGGPENREVIGEIFKDEGGKLYLEFAFTFRSEWGNMRGDMSIKEDGRTLFIVDGAFKSDLRFKKEDRR